MMVLQTIIVYLVLIVVLYVSGKNAISKNSFFPIIGAVLFYALVFGLRSGVGVDFWGYKEWYSILSSGLELYNDVEPGFRLLMNLCVKVGLPFSVFLMIIAYTQLILVYLALKPYKSIYPMLALTFMLGCVWLTYANGMRQQLAFCVFVYSIQFIVRKEFLKYCFSVLIAFTFHTSAILLLIAYPLFVFGREWFKRISIQYALFVISLVMSTMSIVLSLVEPIEQFADILGYGHYFNTYTSEFSNDVKIGVGYFINIFIAIALIYNSDRVKQFYNSKFVNIVYDLFFVGVLWQYIFIDSPLFARLNYYMQGFQYIYAAFCLTALWKTRNYQYYIILISYALVFVANLYRMGDNTAMFMFTWQ